MFGLTLDVSTASTIELEELASRQPANEQEASTELAHVAAMQQIEKWYQFSGAKEVKNYLNQHRELVPVLIEAFSALQRIFGPNPTVVLEAITDPELEWLVQLHGNIVTSLLPQDALTQLDKFDSEWFFSQYDRIGNNLNFNLHFVA
jgi:hypothetical protein